MDELASGRERYLRLLIVFIASLTAILGTIFSLVHHIASAFPFLYILPIICMVYFYPHRAVLFTLCLSIIYIGLVYILDLGDPLLIAVSTAWFAIFVTLAIVASSYANGINEEKKRIQNIMDSTLEGIICFSSGTWQIREINQKCARWLLYSRDELIGNPVSTIWTDTDAHQSFIDSIKTKKIGAKSEALFRQKTGGVIRVFLSPVYISKELILCSVVNVTDTRIGDEEIRQTLEDLERQVKERTSHLEKMNADLRSEILKHRQLENELLSGKREMDPDDTEEEMS